MTPPDPTRTVGPPSGPTPEDPRQLDAGRASTMLWRALRLRCPNCGGGRLFRRWIVIEPTCPSCHLKTDRGEEDYFLGSYLVNFVTAELIIVSVALGTVFWSWPDVPWNGILYGLMAAMIPVPILFYPFSKTIWLAIDLTFRPLTWADLEGHGENEGPASSDDRVG